jgi:hypothetical protein
LKIIFVLRERQVPYDEQYHLATMTRQQLRQPRQKKIARHEPEKVSLAMHARDIVAVDFFLVPTLTGLGR